MHSDFILFHNEPPLFVARSGTDVFLMKSTSLYTSDIRGAWICGSVFAESIGLHPSTGAAIPISASTAKFNC